MRRYCVILVEMIWLLSMSVMADDLYFVYLRDKSGTQFSLSQPEQYLSQRAIERRERQGISIDSTDLPVSLLYLDSIQRFGAEVVHSSRWLNGVTVRATAQQIREIRNLSFVKSAQLTRVDPNRPRRHAPKLVNISTEDSTKTIDAHWQYEQLNLHLLHDKGFRGQGMRIAIVDNGFLNFDRVEGLSHMREQICDTFNLVPSEGGLYEGGAHGTYVASIIGGLIVDTPTVEPYANVSPNILYEGGATEAEYALIRSEEDSWESMSEVDNQVRAFELADSLGADIINSSLGYYDSDDSTITFSHENLTGRYARNSVAATLAARKGMIVCIAAGNEAGSAWHYIDTPADADSILTVGSVDEDGLYSSFSSVGPTADGRVKPDIATMGGMTFVISTSGQISRGSGTSFASPLMASAVACLWSALPRMNNMQIIEIIKQNASNSLSPNNEIGYGIPDMWQCYDSNKPDDTKLETPAAETPAAETPAVETPASVSPYDNIDNGMLLFDLMGRRIMDLPQHGVVIIRKGNRARKVVL